MKELVIDLSYHNGSVDFQKMKNAGVYGVIIRAGYGKVASQKDKKFEEFYKGATEAGLHVGTYWYSYAKSVSEAEIEMDLFIKVIEGKKWDMFVAFDLEDASQQGLGKEKLTNMAVAALNKIHNAGYVAVLYSNPNWLTNYLSVSQMPDYTKYWVACYSTASKYKVWTDSTFASMWQYSEKGTCSGVSGNCDVNYCYVDFPSLNGTTTTESSNDVELEINYTTANLNYRNQPSTSSASVGVLPAGTAVSVVKGYSVEANGYTWTKISKDGKLYYVAKKYLSKTKPTTTKKLVVKKGSWNIRKSSALNSAVVKVISGQPTLEYTTTSTNSGVTWYYLPKYSGWISKTAVDKLL